MSLEANFPSTFRRAADHRQWSLADTSWGSRETWQRKLVKAESDRGGWVQNFRMELEKDNDWKYCPNFFLGSGLKQLAIKQRWQPLGQHLDGDAWWTMICVTWFNEVLSQKLNELDEPCHDFVWMSCLARKKIWICNNIWIYLYINIYGKDTVSWEVLS